MSDPKRYDLQGDYDCHICQHQEGDYVLYDDYAALQKQNAVLRQSLERIHKAADEGSADPAQFRVLIRAEARNALTSPAADTETKESNA